MPILPLIFSGGGVVYHTTDISEWRALVLLNSGGRVAAILIDMAEQQALVKYPNERVL